MQFHYFDSASTTPCSPEAAQAVQKYSTELYGNPSSHHPLGRASTQIIQEARSFFAQHLRVNPEQVIFTSSGTEANNLAIWGASQKQIFTSYAEHPSIVKAASGLPGHEVQFLPLTPAGEPILSGIPPMTKGLLTLQRVNHILGSIVDIEKIAQQAKTLSPQLIVHVDAIQAFGKISVPTQGIDLLSISGHKISGPKGIGALIVLNKNLKLRPLIWGGGQEHGLRSGTQNAGLIAGFYEAARIALKEQNSRFEKLVGLRKYWDQSANAILASHAVMNSPTNALPSILNLSFPGFPAGPLANFLAERGCYVSVGSACHSHRFEPDPVLQGVGLSPERQKSAIRLSFSHLNSEKEIDQLILALTDSLQQMQKIIR